MKYLILLLSLYLICCQSSQESDTLDDQPVFVSGDDDGEKELPPSVVDTFLEANDPQWLNLAQNQLFLDTTRNSDFFQYLQKWNPRIYHLRTIEAYRKKLEKGYAPSRVKLPRFPKAFLQLREAHGQFVLYDRCHGMDPRYFLEENLFITYDTTGVSPKVIEGIGAHSRDQLELILWEDPWGAGAHTSTVSIEKTLQPHVYELTYRNQGSVRKEWVTPKEHLNKFDLLVNHCPEIRVPEYAGF